MTGPKQIHMTWIDGFGCEQRSLVLSLFWDDGYQFAVVKHREEYRILRVFPNQDWTTKATVEMLGIVA